MVESPIRKNTTRALGKSIKDYLRHSHPTWKMSPSKYLDSVAKRDPTSGCGGGDSMLNIIVSISIVSTSTCDFSSISIVLA